jgi:hypothetical protein
MDARTARTDAAELLGGLSSVEVPCGGGWLRLRKIQHVGVTCVLSDPGPAPPVACWLNPFGVFTTAHEVIGGSWVERFGDEADDIRDRMRAALRCAVDERNAKQLPRLPWYRVAP